MRGAIVSLLCTAILGASPAVRAQPSRTLASGPGAHLEQNLKALDLTAEQKDKVQSILEASHKDRETRRGQLQQAFKELRALLEQPSPDEQAVLRQADKIGALRTQQQKAVLSALLKVIAVLTPAQRTQLAELRRRGAPGGGAGEKGTPPRSTPAAAAQTPPARHE